MEKTKQLVVWLLVVSAACLAQSPRPVRELMTLLQEAQYQEQTAGDLDKAIDLYEQVLVEAAEVERLAARATFQLAVCYQKKGDTAKAAEYFRKVVADFPSQKSLAERAQEQLNKLALTEISEIVGRWISVDFVPDPEQFQPGEQQWKGDLFLKETTFFVDGSSSHSWRWTEGWIHDTKSGVKAQYYIKPIGDETYLFLPWLSGDVTLRGQKPRYYVLKSVTPRPPKTLSLEPAPWVDGEMMELRLKRPAGREYGTIIYSAQHNLYDGRDSWQIVSHTYVRDGNVGQYTLVEADTDSFAPFYGQTLNWMGNFVAEYDNGSITLTAGAAGQETTRDVSLPEIHYDNEQALYLIRRMPLTEGYEGSFPIFTVQGGASVECRIKVLGREELSVEAGTFDCFKIDLSVYYGQARTLQHTLWFSADEHKYLVKYDVGGTATMELNGVRQKDKDAPVVFENAAPAFSVLLPADWRFYRYESPGPQFSLQMLSPELSPWAVLVWQKRGDDPDSASAVSIAQADCEKLKSHFENYTLDENSWQTFEIDALEAVRFTADYQESGTGLQAHAVPKQMTEYRAYLVDASNVFWFVFRTDKETFDAQQPVFDAIINSFRK